MKRYVCLLACLLLMVMSIPVFAVPEDETQPDDGYTHLEVLMDCVVDTDAKTLVVGLKDQNGGAVNGYVYIEVDGEQFGDGVNAVDHDNRVSGAVAKLNYASVPATAASVQVVSMSYTWDVILFEEARQDVTAEVFASLGYTVNTTTSPTQTTQAQQTDATTAPVETTPTTGVPQGNREQLAIDVDAPLAEHFGYSEAELESRIKAYVNADDYRYYVGDSAAKLHLQIAYDDVRSEDTSRFLEAKNADERYTSYADADVNGMAFAISLVFTDEAGHAEILDVAELKYDMEMVIPASMQKTKELTFAVINEDGKLSELKAAYPSNGAIVLSLSSFQSFAVVSFGTQTEKVVEKPGVFEAMLNVFNTWQTALAFVGGVVLIVGGVILVVLISLRKRRIEEEEAIEAEIENMPKLSEDACKTPVPSRKPTVAEEPQKTSQKRTLDEAIPVIHRIDGDEPIDPEAFGRLSEQSVTPAKVTAPRPVPKTTPENNGGQQNVPSVDDLLDELTEDIENLKKK